MDIEPEKSEGKLIIIFSEYTYIFRVGWVRGHERWNLFKFAVISETTRYIPLTRKL